MKPITKKRAEGFQPLASGKAQQKLPSENLKRECETFYSKSDKLKESIIEKHFRMQIRA